MTPCWQKEFIYCLEAFLCFYLLELIDTATPTYKGHSRVPENVPFIYRLELYTLFINGENEAALYRQ